MRAWLTVLLLVLGGCDLNGRDLTYPGASVFQPSTKDFHFHFLAPPWLINSAPKNALLELKIPATTMGPGTIDSSHVLTIRRADAATPTAAGQAQLAVEKKSGHSVVANGMVKTLTGEVGVDLQSYQDLPQGRACYRETFFAAPPGYPVVRFSLLSAYPTDELEIQDLLESFSLGPDLDTPAPERVK